MFIIKQNAPTGNRFKIKRISRPAGVFDNVCTAGSLIPENNGAESSGATGGLGTAGGIGAAAGIAGIAKEAKAHLLSRRPKFEIALPFRTPAYRSVGRHDFALQVIGEAYKDRAPFATDDFDYLRYSIRKIQASTMIMPHKAIIRYNIEYLTTRNQEEQIEKRIVGIFEENNIHKMAGDYAKARFIYGFIVNNVRYDETRQKLSVHNALFDKSAVCEGCAALLYRMLMTAKIQSKIITGKGLHERHAWNIVRLDGLWYNSDVTWDLYLGAGGVPAAYQWFLKCGRSFTGHTRDDAFNASDFNAQYPMSPNDYPTM